MTSFLRSPGTGGWLVAGEAGIGKSGILVENGDGTGTVTFNVSS